jgi:SAM-dependent methyltransferase
MLQMITSLWVSQSVGAVARFGIADQIADQPKTGQEIAKAVGANADAILRLMRALASIGVFRQVEGGRFGLTPLGETLRSDVPGSVRDFAIAEVDQAHWQPWGRMHESIKTGRPVSKAALGMEVWEWYAQNPHDEIAFSSAMGNLAQMVAGDLPRLVDFSDVQRVVDVGGAHGVLLASILRANPKVRGILFDLPHVIETAKPVIKAQGLDGRCELVGGDFFKQIPDGADVHILKHIIHDWDDERASLILRNCHRALRPNGRIVLVEMIIPADNSPSPAQFIDLNMLVLLGGRERSEAEYETLLRSAGFKTPRLIPTGSPFFIIEAEPA